MATAARLRRILDRDGDTCVWCGRTIATRLVPATVEHLVPRARGGPSRIENEVAACARCNGRRRHRPLAEWFEECERLGWTPDRARILGRLEELATAIAAEGGNRRARDYVRHQRKRLGG